MSAEVKETVFGTSKSEKVEATKVASASKEVEVKEIKVKAIANGFYKNRRIFVDDEFEIPENMFSKNWMKKI